ncbi:MAG: redoxin domain-containing protein [Campylobacterota bacterium]|nr:redoxin domain-containing protein [Campylobacterota bacterium]
MRVIVTLLILLFLGSCGVDKESTQAQQTSVTPKKENNHTEPKPIVKEEEKTHDVENVVPKEELAPKLDRSDKEIFAIHDFSQDASKAKKFTVYKEGIDFKNIAQKIVVLNFITQDCSPCIGQFPYLSDLQNKYRDDLFLMGIMLDSTMSQKQLHSFANDKQVLFFLGDSEQNTRLVDTVAKQLGIKNLVLPLTVIYHNGAYYMHYEGAAPIEMIESDIGQILKK